MADLKLRAMDPRVSGRDNYCRSRRISPGDSRKCHSTRLSGRSRNFGYDQGLPGSIAGLRGSRNLLRFPDTCADRGTVPVLGPAVQNPNSARTVPDTPPTISLIAAERDIGVASILEMRSKSDSIAQLL